MGRFDLASFCQGLRGQPAMRVPATQEEMAAPVLPSFPLPLPSTPLPSGLPPTFFVPIPPSPPADMESISNTTNRLGATNDAIETTRICGLPIWTPMSPEEVEEFSQRVCLSSALRSGFRLKPAQANGLAAYAMHNGMFGAIGVGAGKTLTSLLILQHAFKAGRRNPLLSVPARVFRQLAERDIREARDWVPFDAPIHLFPGKNQNERRALARSRKRGIYITTHSLLSQKDAHEILEELQPQTVVLDEAHYFANLRAARSRRVMQCLEEAYVCGMSGTITRKSVMDYWHLIRACLRTNNPLPNVAVLASEWGAVIDAQASPDQVRRGGSLTRLTHWARNNFPSEAPQIGDDMAGFRKAYRLRKDSAPGYVSYDEDDLGTSLTISNEKVEVAEDYPGRKQLDQMIDDVLSFVAPTGDVIDCAMHTFKWCFELTAGFYNSLVWPSVEKLAERRKIGISEATQLLHDAKIAHDAKQVLNGEMREFLRERARNGLDTPLLVEAAMARKGGAGMVTPALYQAWQDWRTLHDDSLPVRDSIPVQVCDYKVASAVKWAKEQQADGATVLLWYCHKEIGLWLAQLCEKEGLNHEYLPAGNVSNRLLVESENLAGKILILSVWAHGEGKNLQKYARTEQLFVQWPRGATVAEQAIGRTHRTGQQADELIVKTCLTTEWDQEMMAACVVDSLYAHQTMGRQKMIYCGWDPLPKLYPPEALRQRGFENRLLTAEQKVELYRKFGSRT